jgi:hypothetical protein
MVASSSKCVFYCEKLQDSKDLSQIIVIDDGHKIIRKGKKPFVQDFEMMQLRLRSFSTLASILQTHRQQ